MTIKYEPVFGDQSLFDNAPEDADMIGYSGGFYKNSPDGPMYRCGCTFTTDEYRNKGFIAMRRIIKDPKRWTRADQEAGVLPPIGAKCLWVDKSGVPGEGHAVYPKEGTEVEIIAHYTNIKTIVVFIWVDEDGDTVNSCSCEVSDFAPIETPEEKAQRVKQEWLLHAEGLCQFGKFLEGVYDALLSGELKAPSND